MNFINLCPHAIVLNDGRVFEPSGHVARVSVSFSPFEGEFCTQQFGAIVGFPEGLQTSDTYYIVSAMVLSAAKEGDDIFLPDLFCAPATGHPDCVRNPAGQIVSVPGFVR